MVGAADLSHEGFVFNLTLAPPSLYLLVILSLSAAFPMLYVPLLPHFTLYQISVVLYNVL